METRSFAKIGQLELRSHFQSSNPKRRAIDVLTEVLKYKYTKDEALISFCESNKLYPKGYPKVTIKKAFQLEQRALKQVALMILSKDEKERNEALEKINKRIIEGHPSFVKITESKLSEGNHDKNLLNIDGSNQFIVRTTTYPDSFSPLWDELAQRSLIERSLGICRNCGDFFLKLKRHSKEFCSDGCREKYSKKKRYHEQRPPR